MGLLTVPNWSFGRDRFLLQKFENALAQRQVTVHFLKSDVDHNRTVSAFSGEVRSVFETMDALCELAFDTIDLNRHVGVHPRIGALDVCPFLPIVQSGTVPPTGEIEDAMEAFAKRTSDRYDLPIYLYEKSERGRHESDLPTLRRGGFGTLLERTIDPDFGPDKAHRYLGVTVMGRRDFLIAMNVDLQSERADVARDIAESIRIRRREGDPRFLGVRALGLPLVSRRKVQVSMNITLPDLTDVDPIVDFIADESRKRGVRLSGTELIGVIRTRDLPTATHLEPFASQVVDEPISDHAS